MTSNLPNLSVSNTAFSTPVKRIFDARGTQDFHSSVAFSRLEVWLSHYIGLVEELSVPDASYRSYAKSVNLLVDILSNMDHLVDAVPPLPGPRRYGNLACREWHRRIDLQMTKWLESYLQEVCKDYDDKLYTPIIAELEYYFLNSFGSSTRLDYGTGHELSFLALIGALQMINVFKLNGNDLLFIFDNYYKLVQKLILTYTLEPAGSHGVWGLDDHFHLAYILGSSQYCKKESATAASSTFQASIQPRDILNRGIVTENSTSNLYCRTINFIYQVKSGPFSEHSPILYDIAKTVHSWQKVRKGLMKMYYVEVLNKFPVVQHFYFGTGFYSWINPNTKEKLPTYEVEDSQNSSSSFNTNNESSFTTAFTNTNSMPLDNQASAQNASSSIRTNRISQMNPPLMRTVNSYTSRRTPNSREDVNGTANLNRFRRRQ